MEQYTGLAEIYDMTIDADYDKWMEFVKKYMESRGIDIKGKRLLELGCGTGNMTTRLREAGLDVTAIDISHEMLSVAEEKARSKRMRINFLNQDMAHFCLNRDFEIAASFCDGYNYIIEEGELLGSFKRVYDHLSRGGYFIFDISTSYKLRNLIGNNTFTVNEEDLCYIWDNYVDDDIIEMYITFFIKEGKLYRRMEEHHIQKIYEVEHIIGALKASGFKRVEVYDDYSFKPVYDKTARATFIASKED